MKKRISVWALSAFLLLATFLLVACRTKSDTVFTYYRTVTENGAETEYVLTVDEKNQTFSIDCKLAPQKSYSGTFIYKNGYLVLTSTEKGEEYVSVVGDEFSYFTPQKESGHVHDYQFVRETAGTCVSQGLKTYVCSICGKEKQESTSYGTHRYASSHTAGTCSKKEKTVYRCIYCSEEKTVEGNYDETKHNWSEENRNDSGCQKKVTVTRRCKDCQKIESQYELDEYGSHHYDEDGVCTFCRFDTSGFCHTLADEDEDGVCDGYDVPLAVAERFSADGYAMEDGLLYLGVYPSERVEITAEELTENGKKDPITGFYRYGNLSYCLQKINGKEEVFAVKILTWKLLRENATSYTYVCTTAVDAGYYLSPTKIVSEETWVEVDKKATKVTTYYHNDAEDNGERIKANVFAYSDAYTFLNETFSGSLNAKQRAILTPDPILLPDKAFADNDHSVTLSDYARARAESNSYFTCTPCEKTNSVYGSSFGECTEKNITSVLGYVPVITVRFPE